MEVKTNKNGDRVFTLTAAKEAAGNIRPNHKIKGWILESLTEENNMVTFTMRLPFKLIKK